MRRTSEEKNVRLFEKGKHAPKLGNFRSAVSVNPFRDIFFSLLRNTVLNERIVLTTVLIVLVCHLFA